MNTSPTWSGWHKLHFVLLQRPGWCPECSRACGLAVVPGPGHSFMTLHCCMFPSALPLPAVPVLLLLDNVVLIWVREMLRLLMFALAKPHQLFSSQHGLWTVVSAHQGLGVVVWLKHLKLQITWNKRLVEPWFENLGLGFPLWGRGISYRFLTANFAKGVNRFLRDFHPVQFCQWLEHFGGQIVSESGIWTHCFTSLTSHWNSKGLNFELLPLCVCMCVYTHIYISL